MYNLSKIADELGRYGRYHLKAFISYHYILHPIAPKKKHHVHHPKSIERFKFYFTFFILSLILSLPPVSLWRQARPMDELPSGDEDVEMMEGFDGKDQQTMEGNSEMEPHEGMEFESEEAAKVFYDAYATHAGFIMRVDAFRRSMRDGAVVWRRLVCNKEGFRRVKPKQNENRRSRAITREGCKAMIVVKKEKSGKWVVTRFVKEHNHPLVISAANNRRSVPLSHTPDEKDVKIRELSAELQRERKRCAALQGQLNMVLKDIEEHSNQLSRNIKDIIQRVTNIEPHNPTPSHAEFPQ